MNAIPPSDMPEPGEGPAPYDLARFWDLSGDLFSVYDEEGLFVDVNPAWHRVLGWERHELIGREVTDFIHPGDRTAAAAAAATASGGDGRVREAESRWRCADGSYRWLLWSAHMGGAGWCGVAKDITDRKQGDAALRRSEAQLNAIMETAGVAIYVKRAGDYRYLFANPEAERLIGVAPGSVVGLGDEDLTSAAFLGGVRESDRSVIEEGEEISFEEEVQLGGFARTYATTKFPLRDDQGEAYAVCGISMDITEQKAREALMTEGLEWGARIRSAVNEDRLLVYGQPIIDLESGVVVQEELLVRMREPGSTEILAPAAFLPQAERFGLVGEIDRFMVHRGIELAAAGRAVEINLSGDSIGDRALMRAIEGGLRKTGADPSKIIFELTETAAVRDMNAAREFSERVAGLGCRCALDDFGTGYGSLTYQRHLKVHYLKIDVSFVSGMTASQDDQKVVKSIVQLAGEYGQEVVAEGVEDEETLQMLRKFGVTYGQGYHIGRPRPVQGTTFVSDG